MNSITVRKTLRNLGIEYNDTCEAWIREIINHEEDDYTEDVLLTNDNLIKESILDNIPVFFDTDISDDLIEMMAQTLKMCKSNNEMVTEFDVEALMEMMSEYSSLL